MNTSKYKVELRIVIARRHSNFVMMSSYSKNINTNDFPYNDNIYCAIRLELNNIALLTCIPLLSTITKHKTENFQIRIQYDI